MTQNVEGTAELVGKGQRYFVPNYQPREIVLDRGKGARLWDLDGNEYLDLGTGISVCSLGHQDDELVAAVEGQARRLWHASNLYFTEPAVRLAEEMVEATFAERVFFANSGAEANEAAIKLARRHSSLSHGAEKREIVTFEGSFHGRTLATVTATAQPKYHEGFEPLPGGFVYCPFNDREAVARLVSERTCAVMVEPVQGEGGIVPAVPGFLSYLQELCRANDALLIFDEVQCGMGRTGKLFAHEWEPGVEPDVVTLAKALGGGLPIGAMLVGARAEQSLAFGTHGSTFGGNPIVCAAARVVWSRVRSAELQARVTASGERLTDALRAMGDELGLFREIRGKGLMVGAVLDEAWAGKAGDFVERCCQHGVLVLQAGGDVVRFLPPLTITDEELGEALQRVGTAFREAAAG